MYCKVRFKGAGLFPEGLNVPLNIIYDGKTYKQEKGVYRGMSRYGLGVANYDNPVTIEIAANVLRALCGDIPVPTVRPKPEKLIANPIFTEMAKNSFVKYDDYIFKDKNGNDVIMGIEAFHSNKSHVRNSHRKCSKTFVLFDGTERECSGVYDWYSFNRQFCYNSDKLIDFINSIINDDCKKYEFEEVVKKISEHMYEPDYATNVNTFLNETKFKTYNGKRQETMSVPWKYALFGICADPQRLGSNCAFSSVNPRLSVKGFNYRLKISGYIYLCVNDDMIDAIKNNSGIATILDGGIVAIEEYDEKIDEETLINKGYQKIISREDAIKHSKSMRNK